METLLTRYNSFRKAAENGSLGKTAQFWLIYMNLMRYQVMAHTAMQENDHQTLMYCWQQFIPDVFRVEQTTLCKVNI
jgi:hypothetical protein